MSSIIPIFEKYLGHHTHTAGGDLYYYCPKCNWKNPRLAVSFDANKFYCWKCKYGSSNLLTLLYDTRASREDIQTVKNALGIRSENKRAQKKTTIADFKKDLVLLAEPTKRPALEKRFNRTPPKRFLKLPDGAHPFFESKRTIFWKEAYNYLRDDRGLSDFEIRYYRIHYDTSTSTILIPSYDSKGDLNYYTNRKVGKAFGAKYMFPDGVKKSKIIFFENLIDFSQPVILTEGVFDAINIGFNAIPLLGSFMSKVLMEKLIEEKTPEVILFLDNDAIRESLNAFDYLYRKGFLIKLVILKEFKDAGVMDRDSIATLLREAKPVTLPELVALKSNLPVLAPSTPPPPTIAQIPFLNESSTLSRYSHKK